MDMVERLRAAIERLGVDDLNWIWHEDAEIGADVIALRDAAKEALAALTSPVRDPNDPQNMPGPQSGYDPGTRLR